MSLKEKLLSDLKNAAKAGDRERVAVLRLVSAAIHNQEIAKRLKQGTEQLSDEEMIAILQSEAKKRKEAIELYIQGKRPDLAQKEERELLIIQEYLPQQLGREEITKIVDDIIKSGSSAKNFGAVMKEAMKILKGRADAKLVGEIIKTKLGVD